MKNKTIDKIIKLLIPVLVFAFLVMPVVSFGAELIPCGTSYSSKAECDFNDFLKLINNIVRFVFVYLALPIAAIMFAYAGITMVTSGGSTESWSKAKGIFTNTALGLIFSAMSWLIVRVILLSLGYKGEWFGFDKIN